MLEGLKGRMLWLQARQAVLSANVANADTPGFRPKDLAPQGEAGAPLGLAAADSGSSLGSSGGAGPFVSRVAAAFETRASGNAVSLEDEMLKVAETQQEHQLVAGLYQRGLATLKLAIGRKA